MHSSSPGMRQPLTRVAESQVIDQVGPQNGGVASSYAFAVVQISAAGLCPGN